MEPKLVEVNGATGPNSDKVNGIYSPTGDFVNGRPAYRKAFQKTIRWLTFCSDPGCWMGGQQESSKGTFRGDLWGIGSAPLPDQVKEWKVNVVGPGSAARFELQSVSVAVVAFEPKPVEVKGATGPNAGKVNGIYSPTGDIVNGRPAYKKPFQKTTMWLTFCSDRGCWMGGQREANIGTFQGALWAIGSAALPHQVQEWKVNVSSPGDAAKFEVQSVFVEVAALTPIEVKSVAIANPDKVEVDMSVQEIRKTEVSINMLFEDIRKMASSSNVTRDTQTAEADVRSVETETEPWLAENVATCDMEIQTDKVYIVSAMPEVDTYIQTEDATACTVNRNMEIQTDRIHIVNAIPEVDTYIQTEDPPIRTTQIQTDGVHIVKAIPEVDMGIQTDQIHIVKAIPEVDTYIQTEDLPTCTTDIQTDTVHIVSAIPERNMEIQTDTVHIVETMPEFDLEKKADHNQILTGSPEKRKKIRQLDTFIHKEADSIIQKEDQTWTGNHNMEIQTDSVHIVNAVPEVDTYIQTDRVHIVKAIPEVDTYIQTEDPPTCTTDIQTDMVHIVETLPELDMDKHTDHDQIAKGIPRKKKMMRHVDTFIEKQDETFKLNDDQNLDATCDMEIQTDNVHITAGIPEVEEYTQTDHVHIVTAIPEVEVYSQTDSVHTVSRKMQTVNAALLDMETQTQPRLYEWIIDGETQTLPASVHDQAQVVSALAHDQEKQAQSLIDSEVQADLVTEDRKGLLDLAAALVTEDSNGENHVNLDELYFLNRTYGGKLKSGMVITVEGKKKTEPPTGAWANESVSRIFFSLISHICKQKNKKHVSIKLISKGSNMSGDEVYTTWSEKLKESRKELIRSYANDVGILADRVDLEFGDRAQVSFKLLPETEISAIPEIPAIVIKEDASFDNSEERRRKKQLRKVATAPAPEERRDESDQDPDHDVSMGVLNIASIAIGAKKKKKNLRKTASEQVGYE